MDITIKHTARKASTIFYATDSVTKTHCIRGSGSYGQQGDIRWETKVMSLCRLMQEVAAVDDEMI